MKIERIKECGINYDKGLLYFGGDQELYFKYLCEFAKEEMLSDAKRCLKENNIKGAFASIHKLKSLIEYIDIPKANEVTHQMTETLRAGKTDGIEVGIDYLETIFEEIKPVIVEELGL